MNPIQEHNPPAPYTEQEQELALLTGQSPRKVRHILRDPTREAKFIGISPNEQVAYYAEPR